jgi:myo-inositol-1(or 4)-monophosphatase
MLGQVDGYLSLGESSWDVTGALAILSALGASSNFGWTVTDVRQKRAVACGSEPFMQVARAIVAELGIS